MSNLLYISQCNSDPDADRIRIISFVLHNDIIEHVQRRACSLRVFSAVALCVLSAVVVCVLSSVAVVSGVS